MYDIYEDIAQRTNGDIYVGVVGPVRCGKSTFISSFMNKFVLPNIKDANVYARTKDELPQSGDGKFVMTTQPKFVPNEAVKVCFDDKVNMNIRMIDCVGFMVDGVLSGEEDGKSRMLKTPWSSKEMTFEEASEFGTKKVINDHSNIVVFLTTDASISDIQRDSYKKAEIQTLKELRRGGKPFVIALNSKNPKGNDCKALAVQMQKEYKAPIVCIDAQNLEEEDVNEMLAKVLNEFGVKSIKINMPDWLRALPFENSLIQEVAQEIINRVQNISKIADFKNDILMFEQNEHFEPLVIDSIKLGTGEVCFNVVPKQSLFFNVLSKECGVDIKNDYELVYNLKNLSYAKKQFDKLQQALADVEEFGYGVVCPSCEEISLEEPRLVKQGNKSGVQIKASASSIHLMKVEVQTELNPVIGSTEQSEELVRYLNEQFAQEPQKMWQTNMFGKSLQELVSDGINGKIRNVPTDVKRKMQRTLQRVTNEGKGGIICILL